VKADVQEPQLCALENFTRIARGDAGPEDIVVSLDGDDWFAHNDVLENVATAYEDPNVWMTYGSFVHADGRPGFAEEYTAEEWKDVRRGPWKATHLKTMRATLFHKLTDADLKREGVYRDLAWDMVTMFPMLEMCGPEHARFLSDVSYVYNYGHAWEHNAGGDERKREQAMVREIRRLPRRQRLVSL
jgi:hypothetical protein